MSEIIKYNTGAGLGPLDAAILRAASENKNPEEISASVNGAVSPAIAAQRIKDILKSRDWLTFVEKKQLLINSAYELLAKLRSQMEGYVDEKQAGVYLKTIKQLTDQLNDTNLGNDKVLMQIREIHARAMGAAISVAFERALLELQKRYPDIESGEIYEILEESLPLAISSLEEATTDESAQL